MQKIHFSIQINSPREKVWHAMLDDETYREWTKPFNPRSYYEGNWETGSEIKFLGPGEGGEVGGMYSRIKEIRTNEFVSIEHIGMIQNGVIDTISEAVKKWTPAFENYTFTDVDGGTQIDVDIDTNEEYKEMFEGMWPRALDILKGIAEK